MKNFPILPNYPLDFSGPPFYGEYLFQVKQNWKNYKYSEFAMCYRLVGTKGELLPAPPTGSGA
jgi:hypothetical protein